MSTDISRPDFSVVNSSIARLTARASRRPFLVVLLVRAVAGEVVGAVANK